MKAQPENRKPMPFAFRWRDAVRDYGPFSWTPTMISVLLTLATYMDNKTGYAFPSHETLGRGARCPRETATRCLLQAEKQGWLRSGKVKVLGQGWNRKEYWAVIPPEIALLMRKRSDATSPASGKGSDLRRQGSDERPPKAVIPDHTNSQLTRRELSEEADSLLNEEQQEEDPVTPSDTAKAMLSKLTMEDREFIVEALTLTGFPPERASALTIDSLMRQQPKAYLALEKRIRERSDVTAAPKASPRMEPEGEAVGLGQSR